MMSNPHQNRVDKQLLDSATTRNVVHWMVSLALDPSKLADGDSFMDWLDKCGIEYKPMDEGGLVVKHGGGNFIFVTTSQIKDLDEEITAFFQEEGK